MYRVYRVGQFFKNKDKGDIYILANVGLYVTLIGIESGNRWADKSILHTFENLFKINEEEWKIITNNKPNKFIPINIKTITEPDWEL